VNLVDAYAREVVDGRLPAGKYHRLACARHLNDRVRERTAGFPYVFHMEQADRVLRFARQMKHYKGRQFAGQPFEPTPCQVFRLGSMFGWRHAETGLRRFTTAYNEVPRKQGKSFEAAVIAVYVTFFEGEPGAEGYTIATKEKQARIVFDAAKKLVKGSGLSSRIKVNAANMHRESTEQKLEPLGSDSDTTDGLNPHFVGVDELHAFKSRGLLDVMESATGARVNPLIFEITTAGDDPVSVCGDQHDYACRILDGVLEDDPSTLAFFAFIAHADETDDPWSEETWKKANPHWGISVNPEDMRKLAAKAKQMPSAAAEFKQKRLNLWVNASNPCLSIEGWRRGQSSLTQDEWLTSLRGQKCYVGVDLASTLDLMALTALFPPTKDGDRWRLLQTIWTPEDTLRERAHRDRAPYEVWSAQGWLTTPKGKTLDPDIARQRILELRSIVTILQVGFDPWHADAPIKNLITVDGFAETQVIAVPQTYAGLSSAESRFQSEVLEGRVDANGCPVTAWAVSNTVDQQDGKGNIFFTKRKSRGRIDPVKSATTALALALRAQPAQEKRFQMLILGGAAVPAR